MRKQCVAIRHVHFEDLGTFETPIRQAGYDITYLDAAMDDLKAADTADLTVILGGHTLGMQCHPELAPGVLNTG